jgi:hypothetical protein
VAFYNQRAAAENLIKEANNDAGLAAPPDIDLAAKTIGFKEKLAQGAPLDDLLIEAFAVVREAGRRFLGVRHFDVQSIGIVLPARNAHGLGQAAGQPSDLSQRSERLNVALQKVIHQPFQRNSLVSGPFNQKSLDLLLQVHWDMEYGIGPGIVFPSLGSTEIVFRLHIVI